MVVRSEGWCTTGFDWLSKTKPIAIDDRDAACVPLQRQRHMAANREARWRGRCRNRFKPGARSPRCEKGVHPLALPHSSGAIVDVAKESPSSECCEV